MFVIRQEGWNAFYHWSTVGPHSLFSFFFVVCFLIILFHWNAELSGLRSTHNQLDKSLIRLEREFDSMPELQILYTFKIIYLENFHSIYNLVIPSQFYSIKTRLISSRISMLIVFCCFSSYSGILKNWWSNNWQYANIMSCDKAFFFAAILIQSIYSRPQNV